uniref:Uncharacterized protein n=1 Tax=Pseudo-nitzschia australis TaxID=44445 RepID=A0A6V0CJ81_9STRA|mmetsp:Transcript_3806/g.7737  ORF Transcript_3806/g.7737 Transcript_3806/m.7737 type:complete len:714 (+) Transcript_3806:23-2164(+)
MNLSEKRRRKRSYVLEPLETTAEAQDTGECQMAITNSISNNDAYLSTKQHNLITPGTVSRPLDNTSRYQELRPSLPKDIADEIKRSFIIRRTKKLQERKKLISQVRERRELKRLYGYSNQSIGQYSTNSKNHNPSEDQRSYNSSKEYTDNDTMKTQKSIHRVTNSFPSKNVGNEKNTKQKPLGDNRENVEINEQIQGDVYAYKMECVRLKAEKRALKSKLITTDAQTSLRRQQVNDLTSEIQTLRKQLSEWQTKSNKLCELHSKERLKLDAQTSLRRQQVSDLTSEIQTLRKKLLEWQNKSKKLCELHSKERLKFDNSTELIAQAKIGLTKALNDASNLEAKINDLETTVEERDMRIRDLCQTIEQQTQTIEERNMKLKDRSTLLRLNENEKRKLEDEVEVLIASRNGKDTGEALRRLELEREKWLWDREEKIEAAMIELENENNISLEREKFRHLQELDMLTEYSKKRKLQIEEKQRKMQDFVNQQLDDMMDANRELQGKLTTEREELISKSKEQDDAISTLEFQVTDLKNRLATRNRWEKELIFRKAEVESIKEELLVARTQNKLLEAKVNEREMNNNNSESPAKIEEKNPRISKKSLDQFVTSRKDIDRLGMKHRKKETLEGPNLGSGKKTKKKKDKGKKAKKRMFNKTIHGKKKGRKKKPKNIGKSKTKNEASPNSLVVLKKIHRRAKTDKEVPRDMDIPLSIVCTPIQ